MDAIEQKPQGWTWVHPQCLQKLHINHHQTPCFINVAPDTMNTFQAGHATNSHCYRKGSSIYFYPNIHVKTGTVLRLYTDSPFLCDLPRRRRPTPHDVVMNFVQIK